MLRRLAFVSVLLTAGTAVAGMPERLGDELALGDDPVQTVVLPGDRAVVALVGTNRSIAWRDTADYTEEPAGITPVVTARSLTAAGTSEAPVLIAAGEAVETFSVDTTTVPATFTSDGTIALSGLAPSAADLAYSAEYDFVYVADDAGSTVQFVDLVDETSGSVDLDFAPSGLTVMSSDLLVVIGSDDDGPRMAGIALNENGALGEVSDVDLTGLVDTSLVTVASDGAGTTWLVAKNDVYTLLVEVVREPEEEERGAEGRATSPRGCALVDGSAGGFVFRSLSCDLPTDASSLVYGLGLSVGGNETEHVYVGGGVTIGRVDVGEASDFTLDTLDVTLTGRSGDIALSSQEDAYLYVAEPGTGLMAVVAPGPWLEVTSDETTLSGSADTLNLTITAHLETLQACTFTIHQDGDFTGTGAVLEDASGVATDGTPVDVAVPGSDLEDGAGRLFLLCADNDGVAGRASITYFKSGIEAPTITATPGNERVVVEFDALEDATIDHYLIHFDTWNFGAVGAAVGVDSTGTITSPITLAASDASTTRTTTTVDEEGNEVTETDTEAAPYFNHAIENLVNDTPYYFAVSAVDVDGNEGPRSEVVLAQPGVTGGAAALAGDVYGCTCETADGSSASPAFAALLALMGLVRRRETPRSR